MAESSKAETPYDDLIIRVAAMEMFVRVMLYTAAATSERLAWFESEIWGSLTPTQPEGWREVVEYMQETIDDVRARAIANGLA